MKPRKKNKAGSFVFTLLVIVMISVALIVTIMDEEYKKQYEADANAVKDGYSKLDQTLDELYDAINRYEDGLGKFEDIVDIESADWEGASAALKAKLAEVDNFEKEYFASFEDTKKGLTYEDYFNYSINNQPVTQIFEQLKDEVVRELKRAPSLKHMEELIAKYKDKVLAIKTNIARLYDAIAAIEKNGIELADYEAYVQAVNMFNSIKYNIFKVDAKNNVFEHSELTNKFEEMFEAFKPLALNAFVETMQSLPKNVNRIHLGNKDTVASARKLFDSLTKLGFYTFEELEALKNKDFHKAVSALTVAEKHINVLEQMNGILDKDGNPVPGVNALWINQLIDSYKGTKIKCDPQTKMWIENISSYVKEWKTTTWVSDGYGYTLVTNSKDKNYCAEIYNMIDHKTYNDYLEKYADVVSDLKFEVDHIIKMIGKLPAFSYNGAEAISIIRTLISEDLKAVAGDLKFDQIDFVLGYNADNGLNAAYLEFLAYEDAFENYVEVIDEKIADANDAMKSLLRYTCNVNHGSKKCDCELPVIIESKVNASVIEYIDGIILEVISQYGLNEGYFDAELINYYKQARLLLVKKAALESAAAAYEMSTASYKRDGYEALLDMIEIDSGVSYAFEAVLDNGSYVLVEKTFGNDVAPSDRLAVYTVEKCLDIINSRDIEK